MNSPALTKLSTARSRLLLDHPFFGVLALRLHLKEDASIPTLATNGVDIIYSPDFVNDLSMELCISAMAHEVMHCILDHISRRATREPKRWNAACDFVTNPILKDANMRLGDNWLYDPAYIGMSADEVYAKLPDDCGEAQDEILLAAGGTQDTEQTALEWKLATIQAAKVAQGQGQLPSSLQKILNDVLTPNIPWKDVLATFMTERVKDDYSWRRPNPFYSSSGVYLPVMDGVGMGEIVIGLDTSGSVLDVIDEFGSTVKDICAAARPQRVHVIYCDSQVNRVDVFERGQTLNFSAVGGGGTDFRPVFEYVKNNSIDPACLLYLTDMYGSFPDQSPGYPTLWCATSDVRGPFGDTLRIKE